MSEPLVLATWSFGAVATDAVWPLLSSEQSSLDAAIRGCTAVEDDPHVNSVGFGGLPDRSGRVSLDACVMLAPSRCGSVACVRSHRNVAQLARAVMEKTQHVMLVGQDADDFANRIGMETNNLLSEDAHRDYRRWREHYPDAAADSAIHWRPGANAEEDYRHEDDHDTVGVLTLDVAGIVAGACSTSGRSYKVPGRVGDSPIIGHGLYVHPGIGAAVATGTGELVMGVCGTFLAVEIMRRGGTPADAAADTLQRIVGSFELLPEYQVGLIVLAADGRWTSAALREGYVTAVRSNSRNEVIAPDLVML